VILVVIEKSNTLRPTPLLGVSGLLRVLLLLCGGGVKLRFGVIVEVVGV
jgi:hypothetical protein